MRSLVSATSSALPREDTPNTEIYLLENVPIQGRKVELRQLLKLLNFAKNGQPKAALVAGDAGIGKSALLNAFTGLVRDGIYCRVLDLGVCAFDSPAALYVAMVDGLRQEADRILDEALTAVNTVTQELGLRWERQDLVRAIALVKLQESIGGKGAVSQEQLVKAIRSSVPAIKKLRFSVNDSIEKLVDIIINPWVMVATSLLNPIHPQLQAAVQLAEMLRHQQITPVETAPQASPNGLALPGGVPAAEPAASSALMLPAISPETAALARVADVSSVTGHEVLLKNLVGVLDFINTTVSGIDSGLLVVLDEWDRVLAWPDAAREAMKAFLSDVLRHAMDQKKYHLMMVLGVRSEGESYSLGGMLYNHFRTKILLPPVGENIARKLLRNPLREAGLDVSESVSRQVYALSQGNPYWHLKLLAYLKERAESARVRLVDDAFFAKLGIRTVNDLPELAFTRVKLAFLNDETALFKAIAALIRCFGEQPFASTRAIREIGVSQGFTEGYVFEVLRALFRYDFIREMPGASVVSTARDEANGPQYRIESRLMLEFLGAAVNTIEPDIPTGEKLAYLQRIIPLAVASGELDREKTLEVLALSRAMDRPEMLAFLETVFVEAVGSEKPAVRVTALNNLALVDSDSARRAVLAALGDTDALVREYAARNVALLAKRVGDAAFASRAIEGLIAAIDDESVLVRTQVYGALDAFASQAELTRIFLKGMSDAHAAVRLISIRNLVEGAGDIGLELEADSPYLFSTLLDATDDPEPEVRKYACLGLRGHVYNRAGSEAIEALIAMLKTDPDMSVRALAADSLSRLQDERAFKALVEALYADVAEDIKVVVIRSLGKQPGWQAEGIIVDVLRELDETQPALLWICIATLGQIAASERVLGDLDRLRQRIHTDVISSAIVLATARIQERLDALQQMERRLQNAAQPVAGGHEEAVIVPEDEETSILMPDMLEPVRF